VRKHSLPDSQTAARFARGSFAALGSKHMKYVAQVTQVIHSGIHKSVRRNNAGAVITSELPLPNRLEIEINGSESEPCMMFRYTSDDAFCGDTWHESLEDAFHQAEYEYGLNSADFQRSE
jgi:hypothetical protein